VPSEAGRAGDIHQGIEREFVWRAVSAGCAQAAVLVSDPTVSYRATEKRNVLDAVLPDMSAIDNVTL
jgi:hypothetical protein